MSFVIIEKNDPGFQNIELYSILKIVEEPCKELDWYIQYIYATGEINEIVGMSMLQFEDKCNNSEYGIKITFEKLKALANAIDDIFDILVIGCKRDRKIKRLPENNYYCTNKDCEVLLSREDSTVWELYSIKKENMVCFERLKKT